MTRAVAMLTLSLLGAAVPPPSRPPTPPLPLRAVSGGLPPLPAMTAVRWCESRDDYTAENPTSSASGAFQFIASTFEATTGLPAPASAYPKSVQDAAFRKLWASRPSAWNASRHCWGPLLAVTP